MSTTDDVNGNRARTRAIRSRMAATGDKWTAAARHLDAAKDRIEAASSTERNADLPLEAPMPLTLFTDPAAQARRAELVKLPKSQLAAMLRRGVSTPAGRISHWVGGAHPPERWTKDELVTLMLHIERPDLPWALALYQQGWTAQVRGSVDSLRLTEPDYALGVAAARSAADTPPSRIG